MYCTQLTAWAAGSERAGRLPPLASSALQASPATPSPFPQNRPVIREGLRELALACAGTLPVPHVSAMVSLHPLAPWAVWGAGSCPWGHLQSGCWSRAVSLVPVSRGPGGSGSRASSGASTGPAPFVFPDFILERVQAGRQY